MTREETKKILAVIVATYSTFKPDDFVATLDAWTYLLSDFSYEQVSEATKMHLTSSKFPPTPAEIIDRIYTLSEIETEIAPMEAWDMVRRAIDDANYGADKYFNAFPEIIKKCVGSASNLRTMGADTAFNEGVEKSNFLKNYEKQLEKQRKFNRMPNDIKNRIEQKKEQNKELEDKESGNQ